MSSIAVIGSGLAGLVVARKLSRRHDVSVFEKSRGVGGRMATRYASNFEFDHGAQFFTARTRDFRRFLEPFVESGTVAVWQPAFAEIRGSAITSTRQWDDSTPHYVGSPRMNTLPKTLARDLNVKTGVTISSVRSSRSQWILRDADEFEVGSFDWVILTAPAAQTAGLAKAHPGLAEIACGAEMQACYALMLGFDAPRQLPWQAALVREADISWISVNSSKPGRATNFTLVAHSTNSWAQAHIEDDIDAVRSHLVSEVSRATGFDCRDATGCDIHRWRYANIDRQRGPSCFVDADKRIAACGDWFVRGRVEAAFSSAQALLREMRGELP